MRHRRQDSRRELAAAWPRWIATLSVSTLVVLGLAEAGLRAAGYDPIAKVTSEDRLIIQESDDPVLVYELAPRTAATLWDTAVTINSGGFRDRELPLEKPEGTRRVIALGDSVTFGVRLDTTERWSDRLGARWAYSGLNVEVLNLGVPGYDLQQEVRFLERTGLTYAPDEVIVCFCINDLETISVNFETVATVKRFRSGLLGWSRVAQWLTIRLDRIRQIGTRSQLRDAERIAAAQTRITEDPVLEQLTAELRASIAGAGAPDVFRERRYRVRLSLFTELGRLQLVREEFERLARLAEKHDFGVTVFVAPVLYEGLDVDGWRIGYDIVRHLAESAGLRFIDVYPDVKRAGFDSLYTKPNDAVHLNARGHRAIAGAIVLETRNWFLPDQEPER